MSNVTMKQYSNYSLQRAFTLLELLVVISIIAILVSIGVSSYSTAQKKGRDSKRKSDMRDVAQALEQYYSVCGYQYPTPAANFFTTIICTTPGVSIAIMPTVPSDPRASPYYCFAPVAQNCTASGYNICAQLETEVDNIYCLTNQQ